MARTRIIGNPEEYSAKVRLRPDGKTWQWHIERKGKAYPIQRSVKKYRSPDEAQAAAEAALGELVSALRIVKAKKR